MRFKANNINGFRIIFILYPTLLCMAWFYSQTINGVAQTIVVKVSKTTLANLFILPIGKKELQ